MLRAAERALRETAVNLDVERTTLRDSSAKYSQLKALCNRIRSS
jgi:hypothetical protein